MAHATARIGTVDYATAISAGHEHKITADEGPELGGKDAGPAPYDLLSSALGACTVITLRMYAERKGWRLTDVQVRLFYRWKDIWFGLVKAASFGIAVTLAGSLMGLSTRGGAEGVGRNTTRAVVLGCEAILVLDAFWALVLL